MSPAPGYRIHSPQAFLSSYAPRIRSYGNSLLAPVIPQTTAVPQPRITKRGTTAINYAEDGYDDDFEDSEGPGRRPTGLRSLRREDTEQDKEKASQLGKEIHAPVEVQGIWRDYMGKPRRVLFIARTERQVQTQAVLPFTPIPIKIDIDVQPFRPDPALPMPQNAREFGVDDSIPAYRHPEVTPAFRLTDAFLWNLHEGLITPDQFAKTMVDEIDLPNDRKPAVILQISGLIRTQLEEHAPVALHPLFQPASGVASGAAIPSIQQSSSALAGTPAPSTPGPKTNGTTPITNGINGFHNGDAVGTPGPSGMTNGISNGISNGITNGITATATIAATPEEDVHNPDDTYRCIVNLNINLMNRLYSDKFEWSLLHPPGFAEAFSKQTCADLGLQAEWVPAMAHAIYDSVLRLKKEACENGGLVGYGDIDNDAAEGVEAGWRYEPERLAAEWEPMIENLSKDEIENREKERERQMRRIRRETARFTNPTGPQGGDYFGNTGEETPMGRGERSKKKRRFRSLSPSGRETPDAGAGPSGDGVLKDWERATWRCDHCRIWGSAVWGVKDGPKGARTICHNCGFLYERDKVLPPWSKDLFIADRPYGR
ncbi:Chromatin structure-remodeling complex subunit sfh1 [Venturia nashicola]|nr:Chromatin structure-remodeling complex subunit sfh1 [Venturia nashicola]